MRHKSLLNYNDCPETLPFRLLEKLHLIKRSSSVDVEYVNLDT